MIEKDSIERLKQIVDIIDVVGNYIELKRAGANYVACCPFHDEKTPSFVVSPVKGYFKCYGCGVGGDSLSFIMQKENIEFYEAVEKLAYIYNFTLNYTTTRQSSNLDAVLDKILKYYQKKLNSRNDILEYLTKRGITSQSIEKFAIGYSGESYEFINFLNEQKLPFDELLKIGIINNNERGVYAKFNSRIMFPIHSPSGKIIGFGGRILSGDVAKYINSQQSKLFNKSQILYGYNLAKESIFRNKKMIITEGYIDTIMMSQAGFTNCVATLGTALTKEHLPLLAKSDSEILLCYDGDNAGVNAAFKASLLLADKLGGVIIFKDNKDPADMVFSGKINELMNLLNSPKPFIEFIVEYMANKYDINIPLQKERALKEIFDFFKTLSPILQDEYRIFIANRLKIAPHLLKIKNINKETKPIKENAQIVEDVIIKSILENPNLLDFSLEYLNSDAFYFNKDKFECLLRGELENKELIGLLINQSIIKLDEKDFREQIRLFIINIYKKKLNEAKLSKQLSYEKKILIIKELQNKLNILKSGTLIRVE